MRKIKQKKNELNLVLNSLKPHATDLTLLECKFIILDFEKSLNNVIVSKETALETLATSIINKPIRGYFNEDEEDFGGHELYLKENKNGEKTFERNTIPMGVFTSEGYVETVEVNGESKEVLVADAVLWYSQFKAPLDLLLQWFEDGITISMSCEYLFSNYEVKDNIEYHYSPIYLESHCILGSEILPAYESAKLIDYSQLNQFKQLVAQAVNQENEKEEINLPEEVKDEKLELNEEETETKELQTQLNELSHRDIRNKIEEQLKGSYSENEWIWVSDVYETYAIVSVESSDSYTYYKYEYTIENDAVLVNQESKVEVTEKREWVTITNELQDKISKLESEKADLLTKFNDASETIISLNSTIDELKPFQELALNSQREEKIVELKDKYSKAFNNAGALDKFESEEVQTLLNEAVDSSEALLQLNSMVVDLVTKAQVKENTEQPALLGLNSERKDLIKDVEDEFEKLFKL